MYMCILHPYTTKKRVCKCAKKFLLKAQTYPFRFFWQSWQPILLTAMLLFLATHFAQILLSKFGLSLIISYKHTYMHTGQSSCGWSICQKKQEYLIASIWSCSSGWTASIRCYWCGVLGNICMYRAVSQQPTTPAEAELMYMQHWNLLHKATRHLTY